MVIIHNLSYNLNRSFAIKNIREMN